MNDERSGHPRLTPSAHWVLLLELHSNLHANAQPTNATVVSKLSNFYQISLVLPFHVLASPLLLKH